MGNMYDDMRLNIYENYDNFAISEDEKDYLLEMVNMKEASDYDDYMMESLSDIGSKIADTFRKIKDAIVKFFSNIRDKIVSIFSRKQATETIQQLEKQSKFNPFFGKKKIAVQDTDKINKVHDEHQGKIKSLIARLKAGRSVDPEDIDDLEQSFLEKHEKAIKTTVFISVGALILILKKALPSLINKTKDGQKTAMNTVNEGEKSSQKDPKSAGLFAKLSNLLFKNEQSRIKGFFAFFKSIPSKIGNGSKGTVYMVNTAKSGSAKSTNPRIKVGELSALGRKEASDLYYKNYRNNSFGPTVNKNSNAFVKFGTFDRDDEAGLAPAISIRESVGYDEIPDCFIDEFYDDDFLGI